MASTNELKTLGRRGSVVGKEDAADADDDDGEKALLEEEDRMTQIIGEFGPWQLTWTFLLCIPIVMHSWQMLVNKFLTYK